MFLSCVVWCVDRVDPLKKEGMETEYPNITRKNSVALSQSHNVPPLIFICIGILGICLLKFLNLNYESVFSFLLCQLFDRANKRSYYRRLFLLLFSVIFWLLLNWNFAMNS